MQAGGERGGDVEIASTSRTGQPLPLPKPKTPPRHPDIHGKYRKQAELKHLDQEISLLEEELRSLEGLPPASRCCKEVEEFIHTHPDPLLQSNEQVRKSFCSLKIIDIKGQSTLACCCCPKERSHQPETSCCSCNFFQSWRPSCPKLSCKPPCKIPSSSCCKCSCTGCFRCVKCCHPCRTL
ncbi:guanine nucleotide-binding protein subunit gamma 3 isoform X1 [Cryptomeria japonica]|uniref:guanine nucleotide-binding protein subunit gamma 3 isoform X1 n=1 Tax=Cryptomeria japonica TaxID=3369 RepID=UPI0025AC5444|nr:guanine nucleotide-binding protein subunit gamma 3 isoform X1 [Cryptomeria japonica]